MGVSTEAHEETVIYSLNTYGDIWLVKTREEAIKARHGGNVFWMNADYETPVNNYPVKELKVVKVEIKHELTAYT